MAWMMDTYSMNEAQTRAEHIALALKTAASGVTKNSRVWREHGITLGRLPGGGGNTQIGCSSSRAVRTASV